METKAKGNSYQWKPDGTAVAIGFLFLIGNSMFLYGAFSAAAMLLPGFNIAGWIIGAATLLLNAVALVAVGRRNKRLAMGILVALGIMFAVVLVAGAVFAGVCLLLISGM